MLHPDDITVGMFITGVSNKPREVQDYDFDTGVTTTRIVHDTSYQHDVYRVEAIALPYIAVRSRSGLSSQLDTRQTEIMKVSDEYADAIFYRRNR